MFLDRFLESSVYSPILAVLWVVACGVFLVHKRRFLSGTAPRWLWAAIGLLCIALIAPLVVVSAAGPFLPPIWHRPFEDVRRLDAIIAAIFWVQPLLVALIIVGARSFRWIAVLAGSAELAIALSVCALSAVSLNPP